MYAKQLREQLSVVSTQMNAIVAKAASESNRGLTNEEATQFDNATAEYDKLEASIKRAERAETISADLSKVSRDQLIDVFPNNKESKDAKEAETAAHAKAFSNYLRNGKEGLSADDAVILAKFRNANMSTTVGSQGGYTIPVGFSEKLETATKWFGGADKCGSFETETGNTLTWPTITDVANVGRILGQNTGVTTTNLAFNQVSFSSYIFSSDIVLIPLALMQDSYFDLDGVLANLLGTRMGRLKNTKFTVGAGSGSSEPLGIVAAAVAEGNTVTSASGVAVSFDDLTNLEHAVDPSYRNNPGVAYMFHDNTLLALKKLKDSQNRPIWIPQAQAGQSVVGSESLINGHKFVINNDMATIAVNADAVLFGDLQKFMIRRVAGGPVVKRLDERYMDSLQVGFIGFDRADSNLIDAGTHPVAVLVQAAS